MHCRHRRIGVRVASLEVLEPRQLLAGAPAQLLAQLPQTAEFINYGFQDSAALSDRLIFSGYRFGEHEQLWTTAAGGTQPNLLFTAAGVSPDGQGRFGIGSLTTFNGKVYFFANGTQGDGLFVTDGTAAGTSTVK